jgi:UDP-N-acetylmuramoyl-L-alanyl-D-glutamate--2,6-diaminopimelate ligase
MKRLADILEAGAGSDLRWANTNIAGLTDDVRQVRPGFLFAALPRRNIESQTAAISDAVSAGAAALLVGTGLAGDIRSIPVIEDPEPYRRLASVAAKFYGKQPAIAVAVTGTNGKTSVVSFVHQIWQGLGRRSASIGTLGIVTRDKVERGVYTTPEPIRLHRGLAKLYDDGITHVALEASSHGLAEHRIDGMRLSAGAFTNVSRDHLDYHGTFENYVAVKERLFSRLLEPGAPAIINADGSECTRIIDAAKRRRLSVVTVGRRGRDLQLLEGARVGFGQRLEIATPTRTFKLTLPLIGAFQASNVLVAAGICIALGARENEVIGFLPELKGVEGRLEYLGSTASGGRIFVDFAHTPDGLANALTAMRPYARSKLAVVFGCGGNRDRGKRLQMGQVASENADIVYVCDDNPRDEDPAAIRSEVLVGVPGAIEIGDRREAIRAAIAALGPGDLLLVAGRGHETLQTVGNRSIEFSDRRVVIEMVFGNSADA